MNYRQEPRFGWSFRGVSFLGLALVGMLNLQAQNAAYFPVADSGAHEAGRAAQELGLKAAFDGTNYLVGIQGDAVAHDSIVAQMISPAGAPVGPRISTGGIGGLPAVAFDGTNYFIAWSGADQTPGVFGQFVSKAGVLVGTRVSIATVSSSDLNIAYGAGKYLVWWATGDAIHGRMITPSGGLSGQEFIISGGGIAREAAVAFDGTNFFVAWQERRSGSPEAWDIRARFISLAGALANAFLVSQTPSPRYNPLSMAFDGTNYFVVWNRDVGPGDPQPIQWDIYGRLVSKTGIFPGNEIPIATGVGDQQLPALAFDGSNYLANWSDGLGTIDSRCVFRFFDQTGQPIGANFSLFATQGVNQPLLASALFDGSRYLVTGMLGILDTSKFDFIGGVTYGAFLPKSTALATGPIITIPPASPTVNAGASATLSVAATTAGAAPTYQWQVNGSALTGATSATLSLPNLQPANAGLYAAMVTSGATASTSDAAIVGVTTTSKVIGTGTELQPVNIVHPNGNIFDQVLITGAAETITADAGQVTRTSYIDLNDDIVQVEFSGAGALSLVLDNPSGPAAPLNYNQPSVGYMKGHAGIVITGANETTNVSVFTVGRATAFDPTGRFNILLPISANNVPANNGSSLFQGHAATAFDGIADIAFIAISSANGQFGGVRTSNAHYFATKGYTGVYAPGVQFAGPVFVGNISAFDAATPVLMIGSSPDTRITGGDLLQANSRPVQVGGLTQLKFTAGGDSQGNPLSAKTNRAVLQQNGTDVTSQVVVNPAP